MPSLLPLQHVSKSTSTEPVFIRNTLLPRVCNAGHRHTNIVIFFSLTEAPLPDPTPTPPNTPKRTRNGPKTDPKRSQTEPNGAKTEPNGAEMDRNQAFRGGTGGGLCRGGGGGGGCKGKRMSLHQYDILSFRRGKCHQYCLQKGDRKQGRGFRRSVAGGKAKSL